MMATKQTFSARQNADSIEFCCNEGYRNVFVCGMYQLVEDSAEHTGEVQRRIGGLHFFVGNSSDESGRGASFGA